MNDILVSDFYNLGCKDETQALITLQVYLELCEVKRYWEVEYKFNMNIQRMCLTAKKTKTGPICIFIPILAAERLSFLELRDLLTSSVVYQGKSVYLALLSSDSTCVYYQIVDGLERPSDMSAKHLRENKQEKLDADIRKHRTLLEQSALFGIPITLNKDEGGSKLNE